MKKLIFAFAVLALAAASAADRYTLELTSPSMVAGQVLQPGVYKLELTGNHAILKKGKTVVETEARVEKENRKFESTAIRYASDSPNAKIEEIQLGGTTTKVVFNGQASGN